MECLWFGGDSTRSVRSNYELKYPARSSGAIIMKRVAQVASMPFVYLLALSVLALALSSCSFARKPQTDVAGLLLQNTDVPEDWTLDWTLSARTSRSVANDLPLTAVDFAATSFEKSGLSISGEANIGHVIWLFRNERAASKHYQAANKKPGLTAPGTLIGLDYESQLADDFQMSCEQVKDDIFACTASARYGSLTSSISAPIGPETGLSRDTFISMLRQFEDNLGHYLYD